MAALYVLFWGTHPYVRHTKVLTCSPSSDSALWERGGSCFFEIKVPQSRSVAKVARLNPARPGPGQGLEVAHDIPPHSPGYRQAGWHDWGAPGAILISTKTLRKYFEVSSTFFRGPVAALYVRFWGSHPYVRHTNVLTCSPSSDSALWERGGSCFF